MIKLVYCISKKPGLTDEGFFHYWKEIHGPIGARIPGLRKLVQNHTTVETNQMWSADYDGMGELWFDDMKSLMKARNTAEWNASTEDGENFIDHSKVAFFITEEHEIV
jgi:uncharacterized protein (TIGR02118 family)